MDLRDIVQPDLPIGRILPEDIPRLFDTWMAKADGPEWLDYKLSHQVEKLLKKVVTDGGLTYQTVKDEIRSKKPIPPTTLRNWILAAGGRYEAGAVCPESVLKALYKRLQRWTPKNAMRL
jgi:hypothetical protein